MKTNIILPRLLGLILAFTPWLGYGEELGGNLIYDGGMEEWKETGPSSSWWNYLTVNCKAWSLSKDAKGNLLTPEILSQFCGGETMKMEEGDIHGGKKALRLKGEYYLRESAPDAYKTSEGDEYVVRYWAKGSGRTVMHMHVYGEGGAQIVRQTGSPVSNQWTLIEERIQVTGKAPSTIYPRLSASEEMLIDDVFVARVVKEEDVKLRPISPALSERIAFAADAAEPIAIDGRLDEPSWSRVTRTEGMRYYRDQTTLAPTPCFVRILFDEQALYFGIEIHQPECERIYEALQKDPLKNSDGTPRDKKEAFSGRHSVEVFLQPPDISRYCQFVVSMDGYRYDGAGQDAGWNGAWECAVQPMGDRWVAEMKFPAKDFGLERLVRNSVWKLNLCVNKDGPYATWSAVGGAFHNPCAFGDMILADFGKWCEEKTAERSTAQTQIRQDSQNLGLSYETRLSDIDAYLRGIKSDGGQSMDWETMVRRYGVLNFANYSYRCIQQEIRYIKFVKGN